MATQTETATQTASTLTLEPPQALQVVTYAVPARYFLVALRGIVLKGTALEHLLPQLGALTAYAAAMFTLASVRLARGRG